MRANRRACSLAAAALLAAAPALAQTTPPSAPTVPLLIGAGEAEAVIRLGRPDIARHEAGGAVWTYRRPGCALFLYLKAAPDLRVTGAAAGPRRRGQPAPETNACLAAVAADKQ